MSYFKELDGDMAVLCFRGVYRQCPLYVWEGRLFAKHGNGFVRLAVDGSTSVKGVRVESIQTALPTQRDQFGRLTIPLETMKLLEVQNEG